MDWQIDATRKRNVDETHMPIEQHIRVARKEVLARIKEIEPLQDKIKRLTSEIVACGDLRWKFRLKSDLCNEKSNLEDQVMQLESGKHIAVFDEQVAPFLQAYYRNINRSARPKISRRVSLPGESMIADDDFQESETPQADVVSEFLSEVNKKGPQMKVERQDLCPRCSTDMRMVPAKAVVSCMSCGYTASYLDATTTSISYGEEVEVSTYPEPTLTLSADAIVWFDSLCSQFTSFSYKRINHFNEWLQNFQAKESFEISDDIIKQVMQELHRQRVTDIATITSKKIREVLKQLRLRKTYEHTAQICAKITGKPAPKLSASTEELCRLMFKATQPSFERHCPPDRKNFLSYSYCLYKFLQLLGHDSLLENFTLLKGRDKLQKQDLIFKKICDDLDWTFYAST